MRSPSGHSSCSDLSAVLMRVLAVSPPMALMARMALMMRRRLSPTAVQFSALAALMRICRLRTALSAAVRTSCLSTALSAAARTSLQSAAAELAALTRRSLLSAVSEMSASLRVKMMKSHGLSHHGVSEMALPPMPAPLN